MSRIFDFWVAAGMTVIAYDRELYSGEKRSHYTGENVKVKRTPEPTMREYSIHGEKITARDKKTAFKIYNLKHKKQ